MSHGLKMRWEMAERFLEIHKLEFLFRRTS